MMHSKMSSLGKVGINFAMPKGCRRMALMETQATGKKGFEE